MRRPFHGLPADPDGVPSCDSGISTQGTRRCCSLCNPALRLMVMAIRPRCRTDPDKPPLQRTFTILWLQGGEIKPSQTLSPQMFKRQHRGVKMLQSRLKTGPITIWPYYLRLHSIYHWMTRAAIILIPTTSSSIGRKDGKQGQRYWNQTAWLTATWSRKARAIVHAAWV